MLWMMEGRNLSTNGADGAGIKISNPTTKDLQASHLYTPAVPLPLQFKSVFFIGAATIFADRRTIIPFAYFEVRYYNSRSEKCTPAAGYQAYKYFCMDDITLRYSSHSDQ